MTLTVGSLFTGYGGLDLALDTIHTTRLAWVADNDPGAKLILNHRFPDTPNLDDITTVDWATVEPVDIITGGSPCQDLSHAGKRGGMNTGTRSNLWVTMREAIAALRPSLVVWENVRGAYSADADSALEFCTGCMGDAWYRGSVLRALGRVLGDLSDLGYDSRWHGLRAADVGAPHGRFRVFVVAYPAAGDASESAWRGPEQSHLGSSGDLMLPSAVTLLPTPTNMDSHASGGGYNGQTNVTLTDAIVRQADRWGVYADAIARWETLTRPAPPPTQPSKKGTPQLSPAFSEWLMGLPAGWVTDVPGITRNQALKALGNGVVPQQATAALHQLLALEPA